MIDTAARIALRAGLAGLLALTACGDDPARVSDGGTFDPRAGTRGRGAEDGGATSGAVDAQADADAASGDATGGDGAAASDGSASTTPEAGSDEGDAGGPSGDAYAWATPLLGTYAKRTTQFGVDSILGKETTVVELALVTIDRADDQSPRMTTQLCSLISSWRDGGASLSLERASANPVVVQAVLAGADGNHFRTSTAQRHLGFEPTRVERCTGLAASSAAPKYADQTWIGSTCTCPSSPGVMPAAPGDCRLTDPDGNGKPGVTISGSQPLGPLALDVVMDTSFTIREGSIVPGEAPDVKEDYLSQVSCVSGGDCTINQNTPCGRGEVRLHKLAAGATCDTVAVNAGAFGPPPPFPACP
jgi:hypothetical protein